MRELVLGYDAKEKAVDAESWKADRREMFLIRPEINFPKSVDDMVWESLMPVHGFGQYHQTPPPANPTQTIIIAITMPEDAHHAAYYSNWEGYAPLTPPGPGWQLLGYDIADDVQISGLSNCGYSPEELASLRPTWQPRINEHGLIDTLNHALEFVDITDKRVEEHAPFYVFGIYQIPTHADTQT